MTHNYIGFRQITLDDAVEDHEQGLPSVRVARADTSGVCLHLSTDAFVTWEDKVRTDLLLSSWLRYVDKAADMVGA